MELYGTIYMVIWGSIMWMINHDNPLSWWWEVSAAAYHCCILIYPGTFYGQRQPLAFEPPQGISSLNCVRTSSWSLSNSSCGSKVMHHHENHWGTHFVKFETHIQSMQPKKRTMWHCGMFQKIQKTEYTQLLHSTWKPHKTRMKPRFSPWFFQFFQDFAISMNRQGSAWPGPRGPRGARCWAFDPSGPGNWWDGEGSTYVCIYIYPTYIYIYM
jgi:hypothetical protein